LGRGDGNEQEKMSGGGQKRHGDDDDDGWWCGEEEEDIGWLFFVSSFRWFRCCCWSVPSQDFGAAKRYQPKLAAQTGRKIAAPTARDPKSFPYHVVGVKSNRPQYGQTGGVCGVCCRLF
jgi:hypothetical protein